MKIVLIGNDVSSA